MDGIILQVMSRSMSNLIPRVIHQIYFQGWNEVPHEDRKGIDDLKKRNPRWEYRFYDLPTAREWMRSACPKDVLETFDSIDPAYFAARSDFLRYWLCYTVGGVYLDLKSEAKLPLDDVLREDDAFLLSQWEILRNRPAGQGNHRDLDHVPGDEFVQWFIVSAPRHPFLGAVIENVTRNIRSYRPLRDGVGRIGVLRTTGPIAFTKAIHPIRESHPYRILNYESDLGFVYSRYGDIRSHRTRYGRHYETISLPVVQKNAFERQLTQFWYGTLSPQLTRNTNRARKLVRLLLGVGR